MAIWSSIWRSRCRRGFDRFERIAEVIDADEARRQRGRERFRLYRERGIEPATHDMKDEP